MRKDTAIRPLAAAATGGKRRGPTSITMGHFQTYHIFASRWMDAQGTVLIAGSVDREGRLLGG